ncbi:MAG: molecular chaperone DnaJ [Cyanobacteria bacterium M5B4]|nr:pentapeptide repeat-containing protein [Cyanobacteria bacterium KgW148]PLS68815.1 MAG: molecular chaperone DnaJ [Cyanobacteria bacterium M5B4]
MANIQTCYQVLEISPGATWEEINQAYRDLLFVWHPDRIPKDNLRLQEKAEAKLKELNEAREILRSHTNRHSQKSAPPPKKEKAKSPRDYRQHNLSGADLREKDFSGRDFSYANLSYADLTDAFLHKTNFHQANLRGAKLFRANLLQADFSYADLTEANLIGADLSGADLQYADLTGAIVGYANKIMVKLTGANLTGARIPPQLLRN